MASWISIPHHRGRLILLAAFPGSVGVAVLSLSLLGSAGPDHTPPPSNLASSSPRRFPLEINPDPTSLGTLIAGQHAEARITLRNRAPRSMEIQRIETSCPCLRAEPVPIKVGPGESAEVGLIFDPSQEPDFRGGLSIDVVGYGSTGEIAFRTRADLHVRTDPSGGIAQEPMELATMEREDPNRSGKK